jgi:hypothetical protein
VTGQQEDGASGGGYIALGVILAAIGTAALIYSRTGALVFVGAVLSFGRGIRLIRQRRARRELLTRLASDIRSLTGR